MTMTKQNGIDLAEKIEHWFEVSGQKEQPPQLEIVQQSSAGYVSCSFDWPTSNWINAARIEITSEDGKNSNFSIQERLLNEWKKRTNFSQDFWLSD